MIKSNFHHRKTDEPIVTNHKHFLKLTRFKIVPATYHEKSDSEIQILDALVQMASRWQVFANNQGTPIG